MRGSTRAVTAALFTSVALVATACGGGGGGSTSGGNSSGGSSSSGSSSGGSSSSTADSSASSTAGGNGGNTGGAIVIRGCTPQKPLLPGSTSETCGGNLLDATESKLVHYNTETSAPENDIAESIKTTDNQSFTIKLKPGYKFSDGTEVKAKNFVDAWNYTAYCKNGQDNSYFFTPFAGFGDLQSGADCKGTPKSKTMSGLKVVDDHTFTIKTTEKVSNLPVRLGYTAFSPLPDSFAANVKAQGKIPVGAGPFMVTKNTATEILLAKNPNYSGSNKPSVDKITYRIYNDTSAAYTDVLGNQLDFTDAIPSDRLVGDTYKTELEGRNSSKAVGGNSWISFSPADPQLKDNVKLRKAISMAIDRDLIIKKIFNNSVVKADGWVPPVIDGYKAGACREACTFDAAKAKEAFTAAGGYKGTLTMTYNADGDNKSWSEAVANSIKNTLGINAIAVPVPDFSTYLTKLDNNEIKGIFRNGWQMDYPSIENFLAPIYGSTADSNYARYKNKAFDAKLAQAAAAPSVDAANTLYQSAEAQLAADFPTAPLWNRTVNVGWSTKVTNVKMTGFGTVDLTQIKLA